MLHATSRLAHDSIRASPNTPSSDKSAGKRRGKLKPKSLVAASSAAERHVATTVPIGGQRKQPVMAGPRNIRAGVSDLGSGSIIEIGANVHRERVAETVLGFLVYGCPVAVQAERHIKAEGGPACCWKRSWYTHGLR
jgi:hypothetical protein